MFITYSLTSWRHSRKIHCWWRRRRIWGCRYQALSFSKSRPRSGHRLEWHSSHFRARLSCYYQSSPSSHSFWHRSSFLIKLKYNQQECCIDNLGSGNWYMLIPFSYMIIFWFIILPQKCGAILLNRPQLSILTDLKEPFFGAYKLPYLYTPRRKYCLCMKEDIFHGRIRIRKQSID